jgi:hypothetical protein
MNMSAHTQDYISKLTLKAADELLEAYNNIPEDKRSWSPMDAGRSAVDQLAECAMLGDKTAGTIVTHEVNLDFGAYYAQKAALTEEPAKAIALFEEMKPKILAAIAAVPDNDLEVTVQFPWGPMTLSDIIAYPYWNMSYHTGQINYIASLLGCLK